MVIGYSTELGKGGHAKGAAGATEKPARRLQMCKVSSVQCTQGLCGLGLGLGLGAGFG